MSTYLCPPTYVHLPMPTNLPIATYLTMTTYLCQLPTYQHKQTNSLPIPKYKYLIAADLGAGIGLVYF